MDSNNSEVVKLQKACRAVLESNWHESFTIPAKGLYPHQWLWDSCFSAIGTATFDVARAKTEIRSLLRGQWSNGMLPHMIFDSADNHARDRAIWQSWRNAHAPDGLSTSGLTQPPVLAEAIVRVGSHMDIVERRGWYQDMLPALTAYHEWLYTERDPHGEGLVFLIHPWESGLDNSPPWVEELHKHSRPWWIVLIDKLNLHKLVYILRRDTKHVPPGQRLHAIDALLYYNVLWRLRRKNWDIDAIMSRSHFAMQDITFNSILARANDLLKDIAQETGHTLPESLVASMTKTENALEKLWDGYYSQYFSRNFITHKLIKYPSIGTLMPLYAGTISQERAVELVAMLHDKKIFQSSYPIATVPLANGQYKELGYWQGPSWINTNWLIADGLRRYGFEEEANVIVERSIMMVSRSGPYEYFSAKTGAPAGAKDFSWTAALILDMLANNTKT